MKKFIISFLFLLMCELLAASGVAKSSEKEVSGDLSLKPKLGQWSLAPKISWLKETTSHLTAKVEATADTTKLAIITSRVAVITHPQSDARDRLPYLFSQWDYRYLDSRWQEIRKVSAGNKNVALFN